MLREIDGLVFEVLRMGEHYQVAMPTYQRLAKKFRVAGLYAFQQIG